MRAVRVVDLVVCVCVAPVVEEDAAAGDPVESPVVDAAAVVFRGTDYVAAFCLFIWPLYSVLFFFFGLGWVDWNY